MNKLMLKKQYFRMEMKEGTSIEEHIKAMKELADRLAAIKAPVAEEDQVVTLLGSLLSSYLTLVTALEARDEISLSYVQQALIREEQRLKGVDGTGLNMMEGTGQALVGRQFSQPKRGPQQNKVCYEPGHFCRDYPMRRRPETKQKHKAKPASTTDHISFSEESDKAFGASSRSHDKGWIVDLGASSHMTQR